MTVATASRMDFVRAGRAQPVHLDLAADHAFVHRAFAAVCFAVMLAGAVMLPAYTVAGVQMRAILPVGLLILFGILYTNDAWAALQRQGLLLALLGGLAIEGAFVSFVYGTPANEILFAVVSIHVQAAVVLLAAAVVARISGLRAAVIATIAVIAVSAVVAVLQMLDVDAAWSLRTTFAHLQHQALEELEFFGNRRPMGLSFSPIQLATQLTLAFAVFAAAREKERSVTTGATKTSDPAVILALLVFFAACLATATRSPILGGFIFLAIYAALRRAWWIAMTIIFGGLLVYLGWPLLMETIQSTSPRLTRTDDNSAAARLVFAYYGLRLFLDNPLGYGLVFQPYDLWTKYWTDLYMMRAAHGAQENDLHNYVLSMLNFYGIGILLFVPVLMRLLRNAGAYLLFFIPYVVHIAFHNSGPLDNDTIIWFVVGALSANVVARRKPARRKRFEPIDPPQYGAGPALAGAGASARGLHLVGRRDASFRSRRGFRSP